jgi:lipopolysaccharide biosynthesis glycosyltransferase
MNKKALVTMMDRNFMKGFRAFWKSFTYFNQWFNYDFIIIDVGLSAKDRAELKTYYPVTFHDMDTKQYADINMTRTAEHLQKTYYTFEVFSFNEYERVVFLDMDIVVLGDIKELFEVQIGFGACPGYAHKTDAMRHDINSGVFSVHRQYLNNETRSGLIRTSSRGFSMPDQKAINRYFGHRIYKLDKVYNVEKRMEHSKNFQDIYESARILHYVGTKPWQAHDPSNDLENSYKKSEAIWHEWYNHG